MRTSVTFRPDRSRILFLAAMLTAVSLGAAQAEVTTYTTTLNGAIEAPPNASPGVGTVSVEVDDLAQTMRVQAEFFDLMGPTTAAHIHAPTTMPGTGTAGVATTTPTFVGFPLGVTSGSYDHTLDLTLAGSFSASFLAANGNTPAGASAALLQSLAAGTAYFNLHSSNFPGGEIRGFLQPSAVPADPASWGQVKTLFR